MTVRDVIYARRRELDDLLATVASTYAALGENETISGNWTFTGDLSIQDSLLELRNEVGGALDQPEIRLVTGKTTPAADDSTGLISWYFNNDADEEILGASLFMNTLDPVDGTEDTLLAFRTIQNGAMANRLLIRNGIYNSGVTGNDMGANTLNLTELYEGGTRVATLGSNTFVGAQSITGGGLNISQSDDGAGAAPVIYVYRYSASPAVGDTMGRLIFAGDDDAAGTQSYAGLLSYIADPTNGSEDGRLYFQTSVAGSYASRGYIGGGLVMGSPAGGDRGAGTVNATAVYDDNVLLTDYVFDGLLDGRLDVQKWNDRVPNRVKEDGSIEERTHEPAVRFAQRLDDLEPEAYAAKWKANRRLPAFEDKAGEQLSVGEYAQRLLETCEVQAVHIDKLVQRIETLEGRLRGLETRQEQGRTP